MNISALISKEFQLDSNINYLNHAAVSPWPCRTAEAVKRFAHENIHYGATNYLAWLKTETRLREQLCRLINAPSVDDIALLKNTSEALSVVAEGIEWRSGDNIVSSNEEFPSNRIAWLAQAKHGVAFREINIADSNEPEYALIAACDDNTRLITISSVQYGTGRVLNLAIIGEYCQSHNILFCVDAIQSLGALPFDCQAVNADFVMADGHKWMLGPEGIALFYCRAEIRDSLKLHQFGWHMVQDAGNYDAKDLAIADSGKRFECGSPNMLGIHALSASLSLIEEIGMNKISNNIINNISYLIDNMKHINNINFISPTKRAEFAGIVTFKIEGLDMPKLYHKLMKNRLICAHRMGGVRFSPHFYTSQEIIDKSLDILISSI